VLILDKPQGMSSNQALQKVRWLYQAQKGGHTGALDPLATGVLPICLGEASKFSAYLLDADKRYVTTARLGVITATGDSEGEVLETRPVPELERSQVEAVLARFRGSIDQVPTMYSALKHRGRPLYEYARRGLTVERKARRIEIRQLVLDALNGTELTLSVHCSKGTYIRTLVEDIGQALGCGAHVSALRRTSAGHFTLLQAHTIDDLEGARDAGADDLAALDRWLLPIDTLVPDFLSVAIDSASLRSIFNGQVVRIPPRSVEPESFGRLLRVYHPALPAPSVETKFLGLAELVHLPDGGCALQPRRLIRSDG
jgi:tRNA pseudouridine55 synthase